LLEVATLEDILAAVVSQISDAVDDDIPDIQVQPGIMWNPTPPAIDVYPADPLFEDVSYGPVSKFRLTVRARVDTPDREGAQDLLLSLMDPASDIAVRNVLYADEKLGGKAENLLVSSPSEFGYFQDPGGGALLGCTWLAEVWV
jgi:hypothetical protein